MRVLLAIDGSPHSDAAVAQVAGQLWPNGIEVQVLTVVHAAIPLFTEPTLVIVAAHQEQAEDLRQLAPRLVESAAGRVRAGVPHATVTTKIVEGRPKDMIVAEALEWNADLIVLGSHGYGRAKRMVLGSVAGGVVADAPCSVKVVRTKREAVKEVSGDAIGPAA